MGGARRGGVIGGAEVPGRGIERFKLKVKTGDNGDDMWMENSDKVTGECRDGKETAGRRNEASSKSDAERHQ